RTRSKSPDHPRRPPLASARNQPGNPGRGCGISPLMREAEQAMRRLLEIMDKLRDPGGCPWDREQTLRTLTPYLLEEAHEVIEAIEVGDVAHHKEELGDLLFAVANLGRWVKAHPEEALRGSLRRFESRFHHIENKLAERGKSPRESTLSEMDALWEDAKEMEKSAN